MKSRTGGISFSAELFYSLTSTLFGEWRPEVLLGFHMRIPTLFGIAIGRFGVHGSVAAFDERLVGEDGPSANSTDQCCGGIVIGEKHGSLLARVEIKAPGEKKRGDGGHGTR